MGNVVIAALVYRQVGTRRCNVHHQSFPRCRSAAKSVKTGRQTDRKKRHACPAAGDLPTLAALLADSAADPHCQISATINFYDVSLHSLTAVNSVGSFVLLTSLRKEANLNQHQQTHLQPPLAHLLLLVFLRRHLAPESVAVC